MRVLPRRASPAATQLGARTVWSPPETECGRPGGSINWPAQRCLLPAHPRARQGGCGAAELRAGPRGRRIWPLHPSLPRGRGPDSGEGAVDFSVDLHCKAFLLRCHGKRYPGGVWYGLGYSVADRWTVEVRKGPESGYDCSRKSALVRERCRLPLTLCVSSVSVTRVDDAGGATNLRSPVLPPCRRVLRAGKQWRGAAATATGSEIELGVIGLDHGLDAGGSQGSAQAAQAGRGQRPHRRLPRHVTQFP